jgi:hypothetical protein
MRRVTRQWLAEQPACEEGLAWAVAVFGPDFDYSYQEALDLCAEQDQPIFAEWLMDTLGEEFGATKVVTTAPSTPHLYASGHLECRCAIVVAGRVRAGGDISAPSITAGHGIQAGGRLTVPGEIKAGMPNFAPSSGGRRYAVVMGTKNESLFRR